MASFCDISITLIICFIAPISMMAQAPTPVLTSYSSGTSEADRFSQDKPIHHLNPALLPFYRQTTLSAHVVHRFTGVDLSSISLQICHAFDHRFGVGISFFHFGIPEYHQSGIQAGVGRKLSKNLSLGFNQRLSRVKAGGEGRPWSGQTSLSVMWMTDQNGLVISLDGLMPFGNYHPHSSPHPEFKLELAAFHQLHSHTEIFLMMKYESDRIFPVAAIKQVLIENIEIFASFQIYPSRYGVGISFPLYPSLSCMISTQFHPVLGWSPSVGLQKSI